ncbi:hypothetical protein HT102_03455 [Hoyosella sp. G463]|uniref:Uncharacterized protein n=1 Tax=Lolliginicoccus lacisalsi TaxID=2742202 RepID=A0A927JBC9_9ACTN|nr:hypothetical protein [Lolliginicoccus lacisalsi]MBD8505547.1 hypothetical protein [Lolliginicoccus lacisalsi]
MTEPRPSIEPGQVQREIQQVLDQIDAAVSDAGASAAGHAGVAPRVELFEQAHAILVEALGAIDDV